MKKLSISKVKNLPWRFSKPGIVKAPAWTKFPILILFCMPLFLVEGMAQKSSRVFEREIEVSPDAILKTKGPASPRITGNGVIHVRMVDHNYVVSGRKSAEYIYVIDKRFDIQTWDENKIKQVTTVTLECETESQVQALFKDLRIELKENAAGQIRVDCELNIDQFMLENGWFKTDNNTVRLSNGKEYPVKYLELSTRLYIPKAIQLRVESEEVKLSLGDHQGVLDLQMKYGSFSAKTLNELKGKFNSVKIEIDQLNKGDLQTKDSKVQINQANELILDSSLSNYQCKKIGKLVINDSVNDEMNANQSGLLVVEQSLYSKYKIGSVSEAIEANLRNCDLTIHNLEQAVSKVVIKNQNAVVKMGIQHLTSYTLVTKPINQANYKLPSALQKIESNETASIFTYGKQPSTTRIEIDCALCEVTLSEVPF